jgi:lauroyl/myristoyl acyltransferase
MRNPSITEKEIISWTRSDSEIFRRFLPGRATSMVTCLHLASILNDILISKLLCYHPRAGLALAGQLGRLASLSSLFGPHPEEVEAFLNIGTRAECRAIAIEISASALKNLALRSLAEHYGLDRLARLVRSGGIEALRRTLAQGRPVVFVFGHNCPVLGIIAGLSRIDHPVLVIRAARPFRYQTPGHITSCYTHGTVKGGILAMKRAVDQLRSGGAVMIAIWGSEKTGSNREVLMDRQVSMSRGFASIARITGAAVVPVFSLWRNGWIDLNVFTPFPIPDRNNLSSLEIEQRLMDHARVWLERRIRSLPGQIQINQLRWFLKRPPLNMSSKAA